MSENHTTSKREFLKITGATTGGAIVAHGLKELRRVGVDIPGIGEYSFSHSDPRIRIGWHMLKSDDIQPNTAVIAGEMDIRSLYYYESNTIPPYPNDEYEPKALISKLHNSTAASSSDQQIHKNVLSEAKQKNIELISCDGRHFESVGYKKLEDALNLGQERTILTLLGAISVGISDLGYTLYQTRKAGEFKSGPIMKMTLPEAEPSGYLLSTR